jgi:hypothetical protein
VLPSATNVKFVVGMMLAGRHAQLWVYVPEVVGPKVASPQTTDVATQLHDPTCGQPDDAQQSGDADARLVVEHSYELGVDDTLHEHPVLVTAQLTPPLASLVPLPVPDDPPWSTSHAWNPALQTPLGQDEQTSGLPDESAYPAQSASDPHSFQQL